MLKRPFRASPNGLLASKMRELVIITDNACAQDSQSVFTTIIFCAEIMPPCNSVAVHRFSKSALFDIPNLTASGLRQKLRYAIGNSHC